MRRLILSLFLLALTSTVGALSPGAALAHPEKAYFVDLLYLQDGKSPEDALNYFDKIEPIVARHGMQRIAPGFVVTQVMSGKAEPNLVNVWTISDPKNTFDNIFSDPAYTKHIALRNATFDMSRTHMFMMKPSQ